MAKSAAASLLFVANAYFQVASGGYFDPSTDRLPLLHLWSLGVEEQFYLIWPLAVSILLSKRPGKVVRIVLGMSILSALFAAALCVLDPNIAFYSMPTRFWELSLGGLVAMGAMNRLGSSRWAPIGGLALMLLAILLHMGGVAAFNVAIAVLGALTLISAIHFHAPLGHVGRTLACGPMVRTGLISYSLYLWHWPLLAITRHIVVGEVSPIMRASLCLLAVVLAWASYRYIEAPLRRTKFRTSNRRLVGATFVASCALAYLSTVVAEVSRPAPVGASLAEAVRHDLPSDPLGCRFNSLDSLQLFPKPGCGRWRSDAPATVIWGDSHAWAMKPFASVIAARDGTEVLGLTRDSCRPAFDYDVDKAQVLESQKCREFNELAFDAIRPGDTVILVAYWLAQPAQQEMLMEALGKTVARLSPKAKSVLIVGPTPTMRDDVPRCIQRQALDACSVSRQEFDAQASYTDAALRNIASRFANVQYVERASFFCNADVCPPMKDGYGLYWDKHHASSTAARAFASSFLAKEN